MPIDQTSRHTFTLLTINGEDMAPQIHAFARTLGLEALTLERCSVLLLLQLFAGAAAGKLNPARVVHEICALEGQGPSQTKPATRFDRAPLRGLWHKHHTVDGLASMAHNLKNALYKHGIPLFEQRVRDAQASGEDRYIAPEDIGALVEDVTTGNWQRRHAAGEMTGQWLVYVPHDGQNYYLALGFHGGDVKLRQDIDTLCCAEFPFLADLLIDQA